MRAVLAAFAFLIASGAHGADDAVSPALERLADEYWQGYLRSHPTSATSIGDHRYDDQLEDNSPKGIAGERERLSHMLDRAQRFDPSRLSPQDRLTLAALIRECEDGMAGIDCHFEEWVVDPLGGPHIEFLNLPDYTAISTPEDGRKFVRRCRAMGPYLDQHVANLERGLAGGRVAPREAVVKTIDEVEGILALSDEALPLLSPVREERSGWSAAETKRFSEDARAAVEASFRPGLTRYLAFLKERVLPVARPPDKAGLTALPGGVECYRRLIRVHTSLARTPEEIHALGLREIARVREEIAALGARTLGTSDVAEIQRRLRSDPAMHFTSADEVQATAEAALARARAGIPQWFGILPRAACEVRVMGEHEAQHSTIAYYRNGAPDGSRPGHYMLNTSAPETRPRYEAEVLAFHESIPGHHLQIAIAQELTGIPAFRRHQGVTAYVEGWGLYSEKVADEMGLYSSDVDRLGMLSFDAWRGSRLVVDTGLHAFGWTRDQAIQYMTENTVLAPNNIENEVDRYLTWPGQALAYKVGELEIRALRDQAERELGPAFDVRTFHDVILRNGAVALPVLREQVETYIAAVKSRSP